MVLFWHNLFPQDRMARNISLNMQYVLVLKSLRVRGQIQTYGNQIGLGKCLREAYADACKEPYSHLLIDLHPQTPELLRIRSRILDDHPVVYHPSD